MSPILGIYASQISGHLFAPSGAYDSIATATVGAGGVASVTFSSIPQTYKHLQIRCLSKDARTTGAFSSNLFVQFNSNTTAANYTDHYLYGDGSTVYASAATATGKSVIAFNAGTQAGATSTFGVSITDILDYTNTNKNKVVRSLSGVDVNTGGIVGLTSSVWLQTSAITSIQVIPTTANIAQYSSIALYGIKGD